MAAQMLKESAKPLIFRVGSTQSPQLQKYTLDGHIDTVFDDLYKLGFINCKATDVSQKLNLIKIAMAQRTDIFGSMHSYFKSRQTFQAALLQHSSVICGTTTVLPGHFEHV